MKKTFLLTLMLMSLITTSHSMNEKGDTNQKDKSNESGKNTVVALYAQSSPCGANRIIYEEHNMPQQPAKSSTKEERNPNYEFFP